MRWDYVIAHAFGTKMSRRRALGTAARGASAAGAAALLGSTGLHAGVARAARAPGGRAGRSSYSPGALTPEPIDDTMFDVAAVESGAWVPGPYGPGDERGSFNEVTPEKTAEALRLLAPGLATRTYNLGEQLFNGFPAFPTDPPRLYEQRLTLSGYEAPPGFEGFAGSAEPAGPNRISGHEERFPINGTYQIATQLDNLNHVGVGAMFYNGFTGPEIAETWGTNRLGAENMGPIVTRGVVLDILGLKQAQGEMGALSAAPDGAPLLHDDYRITVEDIEAAMDRERIQEIRPGDVVLFRTGWTHLVRTDPARYLAKEPGIYLREARYLARFRPAVIGSDTWALESLNPDVTQGNFFPTHQLLFMRYGIRIGEAIVTEALVADGVFEFVFIVTPQFATGATAGNTPPAALGQPRR